MIHVHRHPSLVSPEVLSQGAVVVIDLLRASTTICWALANGARDVRPVAEVAEAFQAADELGRTNVLLGGERGGVRIEGFDCGNSPAEYSPERVAGKSVLITTTNGTRALLHARLAKRILVGCANNRAAVARALRDEPVVHLLCAGTDGHPTVEDELAAGAIAEGLANLGQEDLALPELGRWRELLAATQGDLPSEQFAHALEQVPHGQTLIRLGFGADLARCAALDTLELVPEFEPLSGVIR